MCAEGIFDVRKRIFKFSGIFFPKKILHFLKKYHHLFDIRYKKYHQILQIQKNTTKLHFWISFVQKSTIKPFFDMGCIFFYQKLCGIFLPQNWWYFFVMCVDFIWQYFLCSVEKVWEVQHWSSLCF